MASYDGRDSFYPSTFDNIYINEAIVSDENQSKDGKANTSHLRPNNSERSPTFLIPNSDDAAKSDKHEDLYENTTIINPVHPQSQNYQTQTSLSRGVVLSVTDEDLHQNPVTNVSPTPRIEQTETLKRFSTNSNQFEKVMRKGRSTEWDPSIRPTANRDFHRTDSERIASICMSRRCCKIIMGVIISVIVLGVVSTSAYFLITYLLSSTEKGTCTDLKLNDISSMESMEENGWTFKNIGQTFLRTSLQETQCESETWYGWKTSDDPGIVSVTFVESGQVTLTYGNCWGQDTVDVLLNSTMISSANANDLKKKVSFEFTEGTTLDIRTVGNGIVKLDSLDIRCSGECCSQIRVGLTNLSSSRLPNQMGYYRKYQSESNNTDMDKLIWKNGNNVYLFKDSNDFWSIGNDYSTSGDMYHPSCTAKCPSLCSNKWKYSKSSWLTNKTMEVSCGLFPDLDGVNNTVGTAVQGTNETGGVDVWNDQPGKYFRKLPEYLIGANYFKMPNLSPRLISNEQIVNITIYRPSTIYVALNSNDEGRWTSDEWNQQNETVETNLVNLTLMFNKTITKNGRTSISLPMNLTNGFEGVVFIVD